MKIGITGITTSGKTTLTNLLVNHFKAKKCCMDDFYFQTDFQQINFRGKMVSNWESPKGIDWEKFEVHCENSFGNVIFIDSFLLLYSKKITNMIDILIILEYKEEDFEIALKRRIKRNFDQEVPYNYLKNPEESEIHYEAAYFKEISWKFAFNFPQYREPENWNKPILKLSATSSIEDNLIKSIKFINKYL